MKGHPRCLTPPEDFVLVPENIPSDHSGILLCRVRFLIRKNGNVLLCKIMTVLGCCIIIVRISTSQKIRF